MTHSMDERPGETDMRIDMQEIIAVVKQTRSLLFDVRAADMVTEKGRADFVTAVDLRVQAFLKSELCKRYPAVQFMGEEQDNSGLDPAGAVWILDPVDGTTNLIHHYNQSAVSLGLYQNGEGIAGVIYQPFTDELFCAVKGGGAYLNGKPIRVSETASLAESLVAVGTNPYCKVTAAANFAVIRRVFEACQDIRRSGSAALDLAYVACGRLDAYFEQNLKPWDYAAGVVLLKEAGGQVTDYEGKPPSVLNNTDLVAGNGKIEPELHRILHEQ